MNISSKLTSHIEKGKVGFPTTLASSVGVIMASPVILTVTSGFGIGGDTFALAVLLSFIMMQAQLTTFSEAAAILPTSGSVYDYISCGMGRFWAITGALSAYLIVHVFTIINFGIWNNTHRNFSIIGSTRRAAQSIENIYGLCEGTRGNHDAQRFAK